MADQAFVAFGPGAPGVPKTEREKANAKIAKAQKRNSAEERRSRVAVMLLSHVPYRQIAGIESCALSTIADDVKVIRRMWRERATEAYQQHLAEELAKLDALERAWLPKAMPLHPLHTAEDASAAGQAALVLDRIARHRARLLGLNMPTRVEVSGVEGGPIILEATEEKVARALSLVREVETVEGAEVIDVESREAG